MKGPQVCAPGSLLRGSDASEAGARLGPEPAAAQGRGDTAHRVVVSALARRVFCQVSPQTSARPSSNLNSWYVSAPNEVNKRHRGDPPNEEPCVKRLKAQCAFPFADHALQSGCSRDGSSACGIPVAKGSETRPGKVFACLVDRHVGRRNRTGLQMRLARRTRSLSSLRPSPRWRTPVCRGRRAWRYCITHWKILV